MNSLRPLLCCRDNETEDRQPLARNPPTPCQFFTRSKTTNAISKGYSIFAIVLAILLNFIWASPAPAQGPKYPMTPMEGLYTYLYAMSIAILGVFIVPSYLPQTWRTKFKLTKREHTSSLGWSHLILAFILGVVSIIYFGVEFRLVHNIFDLEKGSSTDTVDKVLIMKVNSLLALVLIFVQIFFLYKSKQAELYSPIALEGLYEMGIMHIFATNVCLWIKTLTKETVIFALEQTYVEENSTFLQYNTTFNGTTYAIPPFEKPCDALEYFKRKTTDGNCEDYSRSLWTLEEVFFCQDSTETKWENNYGTYIFYPFLSEFSTLMMCVLYEMLDHKHQNITEPVRNVALPVQGIHEEVGNIPEAGEHVPETNFEMSKIPGVGLILGLLPNVLVFTFKAGHEHHETIYATLIGLILISVLFTFGFNTAFIFKPKSSQTGHSDNSSIDENILFITFFGFLLYLTAYMIPHVMIPITGFPENYKIEIALCTITIITIMLQIILVCNILDKTLPPGKHFLRNLLTFIAMCNLSFWFYNFLLDHKLDQAAQSDYYGLYGWAFLWRIACPLLEFFRFHSFITLIQIAWNQQCENQ